VIVPGKRRGDCVHRVGDIGGALKRRPIPRTAISLARHGRQFHHNQRAGPSSTAASGINDGANRRFFYEEERGNAAKDGFTEKKVFCMAYRYLVNTNITYSNVLLYL
jgi:hypothetical protein